jgi:hypothetical protein
MMIAPVDQRDLHRGPPQAADGAQAAEPASDHDDTMPAAAAGLAQGSASSPR